MTRQQIKDRLDSLKAKLSISGGPTQLNASIETTRPNLPAVLQLLASVLREPSFDAKEFEELRQENLAALEQQRSDPIALGFAGLQSHHQSRGRRGTRGTRPPSTSRSRTTPRVTLTDAQSFYAQFLGGSSGELAVVGDFDPPR